MPNKGIMRAKQKRAASLGQSARFYLLGVPKQVAKKGYVKVAGGQGYGKTNPSIGSMVSLGITKQIRKAGGNNICQKSQGVKGMTCGCRGPISYCPNCAGRAGTMNTITGGAGFASKKSFIPITH